MMKRLIPVAHLPVALAVVFISLGSAVADRAAAADRSKGAKCAVIDDPTARLACFDAAFPRPSRASSPEPVSAPAATPAPIQEPAAETQKFGLSDKQRAALEAKPAEQAVAATTATIKTARKLPIGYWRIELDNDQVWQQTEIDPNIWLKPGDQVTIRRASMGSYLLVTPAQYSTRVRRLQ